MLEFKCLIVFLQISWILAQAPGGKDNAEGFSLIQDDLGGAGAGSTNASMDAASNDTSSDEDEADNPFAMFKPGGVYQGDQPMVGAVAPTRLPMSPDVPSTPPPLDRLNANATTMASPATVKPTETPKPKDGSAYLYGNFALVLCGACVLHLLY